jgi:serine/threonine protein kinase
LSVSCGAAITAQMRELSPGSEVGGYRIEAVAGRGGMGVVYRALQRRPERTVALKVIAPELAENPEFRARFDRESNLAARIEHPNVIPVYEVGDEDGLLYIVMRYVAGSDLRTVVSREGRLAPERAARIVAQVAEALDTAHQLGLVHRDVKPGNVLLAGDGEREHAYLTDFGLVKLVEAETSGMTATGAFVGTLDYLAPEQLEGRSDARSDVYALGGVLYNMLTGSPPFPQPTAAAKMWAQLNAPPPVVSAAAPEVPADFDQIVTRAMAKRSDERYPSAGDLGRAALAAATRRSPPEPAAERTVARGDAAPVTTERYSIDAAGRLPETVKETPPTALPEPPPPPPPAETPLPPPADRPMPAGRRRERRAWPLAVAGGALAAIAAAVAVVLAVTGDEEASRPSPALRASDVAAVGEDSITRADFDHWHRISTKLATARKPARRGQTIDFLIDSKVLEQETRRRGLTVSDLEVRKRFEKEKEESFPSEAEYRRFLRTSGQTESDILFRMRLDLLSDKLQRDVTRGVPSNRQQRVLDDFSERLQSRYRAITVCRTGFVTNRCRNGPPLRTGR